MHRAPHTYAPNMNNYNAARMGTPRYRQQLITSYRPPNYSNVSENRDFQMKMSVPPPPLMQMQLRQNVPGPSNQVFQNTFQREQQHFGYQNGTEKYNSTSSTRTGAGNLTVNKTGYQKPAPQMIQVTTPKTSWARNSTSSSVPFGSVAQTSSPKVQMAGNNSTMQPVAKNFSTFPSTHSNPRQVMDTTNYSEFVPDLTTNNNNLQFQIYGSSDSEKTFIFTGTVERVIKWHKIFQNHFCYFEVFGAVIAIQEGTIKQQKIMLLRDKKGPILQIVYYASTRIDIEEFFVGKILRCVGKMSGQNVFNAISIRGATEMEVEVLQRLSLICDQAVSHYLNV